MYGLLTEAFTFPEADLSARLLAGELQDALNETASILQTPGNTLIRNQMDSRVTSRSELQTLYTRLFEVSSGSASVSSVERSYGGGPSQKLWEKLLRFYTFFGLDFSQGSASEQPDHLLTQLAFMHYLCFLEAGSQGSVENIRRGQRDFLSLHLGRWAGAFGKALEKQPNAEPYSAFGRLLVAMVSADLQQLDSSLPAE
jgi:DMSO reductase family type II enzyme chaperone